MHTDKIEFNLRSIEIGDLSGMLSVGLNYGGRLNKTESLACPVCGGATGD